MSIRYLIEYLYSKKSEKIFGSLKIIEENKKKRKIEL